VRDGAGAVGVDLLPGEFLPELEFVGPGEQGAWYLEVRRG
jgi:hypothetical protein